MLTSRSISRTAPLRCTVRPARALGSRGRRHTATVHAWFKFGNNGASSEESGIYGSQTRDDFGEEDMEHYFNYTGRLAVEGSYDTLDKYKATGMHPVDVILLWACEEGDTPKVEELLKAGANLNVKDLNGKSPMDLSKNEEIRELLMQNA